jgi:hypothetical protein
MTGNRRRKLQEVKEGVLKVQEQPVGKVGSMEPIPKAAYFTTLRRLKKARARRGGTWTIHGGRVGTTLLRSREYGRQVRARSKLPTKSKVRTERTEKQEEEEEVVVEERQQKQGGRKRKLHQAATSTRRAVWGARALDSE